MSPPRRRLSGDNLSVVDEGLIARGFWGPKQQQPDQVTDRLLAFITGLDDVVGETLPWSSHDLPGKPLADPENARQVISRAFRENTDAPHLGIVQAYDAASARLQQVSISMSVGGYSDSPRLKNTFIVQWHGAEAAAIADPVLRLLASVWDPDWAEVTSHDLMRSQAEVRPRGDRAPSLGHLTYLPDTRAQALPEGLQKHLRPHGDGGVIIGSGHSDGFLPSEQAVEFAAALRRTEAFSPTPTSRSKF